MVPADQVLGRSSKTENSQIYTANSTVAWRMLVKIHAGLMRSNVKVELEGKMRILMPLKITSFVS